MVTVASWLSMIILGVSLLFLSVSLWLVALSFMKVRQVYLAALEDLAKVLHLGAYYSKGDSKRPELSKEVLEAWTKKNHEALINLKRRAKDRKDKGVRDRVWGPGV